MSKYELIPVNKNCTDSQLRSVHEFLRYRALKVLGHECFDVLETTHELGGELKNIGWFERDLNAGNS